MTKRIHEYEYTSGLEVQHDEERDESLVPDIFDDSIRHVTRTFDEACEVCDTLYKELDDLIKL